MSESDTDFVGFLDGYRQGSFGGWVWVPSRPDHRVEIEILVNGFKVVKVLASDYRPDLIAAGIGDGRHAFDVPLDVDTTQSGPIRVVVQTSEGWVLSGGEIMLGDEPQPSEEDVVAFKAFVAAVLGRSEPAEPLVADEASVPITFVTHAIGHHPVSDQGYAAAMARFLPVLRQIGRVHVVEDPAREVDLLYKAHLSRGEVCVFLSFAPPHLTVLGLLCPTLPVIAWDFPSIPDAVWDGDLRHDWRRVLRQLGRVVTLSGFAHDAVKATMGPEFPVVAILAPVRERRSPIGEMPALPGFIFDSRAQEFSTEMVVPPLPEPEAARALQLDGVVFTAVVSPLDDRQNWRDLVTAFATVHVTEASATLVLWMPKAETGDWWRTLQDDLSRLPAFRCRIAVLQGDLDEAASAALVAASTWVVNASSSEAQCLSVADFMSGGRPAIAPRHTAMLDWIEPSNSLVVASDEEFCAWPQDPDQRLTTTRHRVAWSSLSNAFTEGFRIATVDRALYAALSDAARATATRLCADKVVVAKLDGFLGLGLRRPSVAAARVSPLLRLGEAV